MIGGGTWRKWKQKYGNKYGTNIEQIWSVFLEQIWFKYETNMINAEVYWTNMIGGNEKISNKYRTNMISVEVYGTNMIGGGTWRKWKMPSAEKSWWGDGKIFGRGNTHHHQLAFHNQEKFAMMNIEYLSLFCWVFKSQKMHSKFPFCVPVLSQSYVALNFVYKLW